MSKLWDIIKHRLAQYIKDPSTGAVELTTAGVKVNTLVIGTQGVTPGILKVANGDDITPMPNAYFGIFAERHEWTNNPTNGPYIDNVCGFGWNMTSEQVGEPAMGLSIEQKYCQGDNQPFFMELHMVANGTRMWTSYVSRDTGLAQNGIAGELKLTDSDTSGLNKIRFKFNEGGGANFWEGTSGTNNNVFTFNGHGYDVPVTGQSAIRITPGDGHYPNIGWLLGGVEKANIFVDMTTGQVGWMYCDLHVANAQFHVRGGPLVVDSGSIQTAAPAGGGTAAAWKLGSLVTAPAVLDTTRYIEVDIGGTLYKLAVCT